MTRRIAALVAFVGLVGTGQAYAQSSVPGTGAVVVTLIPGGGTFFTESKAAEAPSFSNYALGAGVDLHFNRYVSVEGEVSGAPGLSQDLQFNGTTSNLKTPNLLNYSGNVVLSVANHSAVVPYATGGVGGLTMFEKASLGINDTQTFLTGNVGGGLKWFSSRHVGLRGDYRFLAVQSKDTAPLFFGSENRYGHRVSAGLIFTY